MKTIKTLLLSTILVLAFAPLWAQSGGAVAVPFLKMDMGARYYGMAGAATAFGDDASAMALYNPAAVGSVEEFEMTATIHEGTLDMKHTYLGLAIPISFLSLTNNKPMSLGLSLYMFDKGSLDEGGMEREIGDDISFALTLGENIASHTWDFLGSTSDVEHYLGVNAKHVRSTLPLPGSGDISGSAWAFDAGYRLVADNRFGVGMAVRNMGTKMKYIEEEDPLPSALSLGMFTALVDVDNMRWDISADYIRHLKEKADRVRLGTEAVFWDLLVVRGGAKFMEEVRTEFTLGFGLKVLGFELDFGTILNPQMDGENVFQFSFSYKLPPGYDSAVTDSFGADAQRRADYNDGKARQTRAAQDEAWRNNNPILYQ